MVRALHAVIVPDGSPLSGSYILHCFIMLDAYDPLSRTYCWLTKPTRKSICQTLDCFRDALTMGEGHVQFHGPVKERVLEFMPDADFDQIDHLVGAPLPLYLLARNVVTDTFYSEIESEQILLPRNIRNDVLEFRSIFPSLKADFFIPL